MSFAASFASEGGFNQVKGFFNDIIGQFFTPRELAAQGVGDVTRKVKKKLW